MEINVKPLVLHKVWSWWR